MYVFWTVGEKMKRSNSGAGRTCKLAVGVKHHRAACLWFHDYKLAMWLCVAVLRRCLAPFSSHPPLLWPCKNSTALSLCGLLEITHRWMPLPGALTWVTDRTGADILYTRPIRADFQTHLWNMRAASQSAPFRAAPLSESICCVCYLSFLVKWLSLYRSGNTS